MKRELLNQHIYTQFCAYIKNENIKVNESLSNYTTFRIGGPADFILTPESVEEIRCIIGTCKENNIPYYVVGNGSNLLVGDVGFQGAIILIGNNMSDLLIEDECKEEEQGHLVKAGAGISLSKLAVEIANHSLTGFEYASGIPGTLGGAVTMNAGAYDGEISHSILRATVLNQNGEQFVLEKEQLQLGYRTSIIQIQSFIVIEVEFAFKKGEKSHIFDKMVKLNQQRKQKQPLEYPSAGSTFKRPKGYFAGKLIMDAGLCGYREGNVMISEKHCGFVINLGDGTAKEVKTLIEHVDQVVFEKFGVHLEPEIRMIGVF